MKGPFDIIFCRNVVIYFDKDTQRALFDRMADVQEPGGWLFVGHSENLFNVTSRYKLVGRTVYRRVG
jgi:chemotaxis protein methyltransferase CheR